MGALWSDVRIDASCAVDRKKCGVGPTAPETSAQQLTQKNSPAHKLSAEQFIIGDVAPKSSWL